MLVCETVSRTTSTEPILKVASLGLTLLFLLLIDRDRATRSSAAAEIARVGSHYAVQGHSRALILVPIESPVCDFLFVNYTNLHSVAHRVQVVRDYCSNLRLRQGGTSL